MFDYSKLRRNYLEQPLKLREHLTYEEIYYLFIELNLCNKEINEILGKQGTWANKEAKFHGLEKTKEQKKISLENYYLKTIGVKNPALKPGVMDKMKQTMKEKYGVENISCRKETIDKRKKTCLEKYGEDNPAKVKEFQEKTKQTNLKKYGVEYVQCLEEFKNKQQETCLKKYGVKIPLQNKQIKEKQRQTCLEKYGNENIMKTENGKQSLKDSLLKEYGQQNAMHIQEFKDKCIKQVKETFKQHKDDIVKQSQKTCMEKYGVKNPSQCSNIKDKKTHTSIKHYGVPNPTQTSQIQQKIYETKKKNNSFNISKEEDYIYNKLTIKFAVKRQFKSEVYPFSCDFYIPHLDLYIEYQGFFSHGNAPFNPDNPEHVNILEQWKEKAKQTNFNGDTKDLYINAIHTWTISDPLKRKTAKDNNLNWIEFYSLEEFDNWFDNL